MKTDRLINTIIVGSALIGSTLLMLQVFMVTLKLIGWIQCSWSTALFPLILLGCFMGIILVSTIIWILIEAYKDEQGREKSDA